MLNASTRIISLTTANQALTLLGTDMKCNLLIVDDDQDMVVLLKSFLKESGLGIAVAKDGYSALDFISRYNFDIIILDKSIPYMSGDQVTKSIRQNQDLNSVPIIILTAKNDSAEIVRSKKLGADEYIVKPVKKEILISKIEELLGNRVKNAVATFNEKEGLELGDSAKGVTLLSLGAGGMVFKSPSEIKPGSPIKNLNFKIYDDIGLKTDNVIATSCRPRSDQSFEVFVSFLPPTAGDLTKLKVWLQKKGI